MTEEKAKADIALERYKDLQDYFSDEETAKSILENQTEFKAWLERLRWNVQKVDELARKLEALEQEPKGEWIPVSERLPEEDESVLFCDIDEEIMIGYHVKGRPRTHFSQDGTYEDIKNVKAWRPLPEPYKPESEGE